MSTTEIEALRRAAGKYKTQIAFAEAIGTSQQNVSNWLKKGKRVAAEWVLPIERATGVPRHELRPDIYPPPRRKAGRAA